MNQILIVEDDEELRGIMRQALEGPNVKICEAANLVEARKGMMKDNYNLVVVDIGLPDGDGLQFFAQEKKAGKWPSSGIVFVTGRDEMKDKVLAFSLGAEDYLVKPVDMRELQARINARLRKAIVARETPGEILQRGDLKIDVMSQRATMRGADGIDRELPLTFSEFKLLNFLLRNEGTVMSREQLLTNIWGNDANIVDRTVDKHISSLRQKLHPKSHYIETIARAGYRFILRD
ncbi:MAG: response regulator transcription factor [Bdellovibrionales bacterium]|nr:response regulator transcription factor [Bdellovibrionales bacterium]